MTFWLQCSALFLADRSIGKLGIGCWLFNNVIYIYFTLKDSKISTLLLYLFITTQTWADQTLRLCPLPGQTRACDILLHCMYLLVTSAMPSISCVNSNLINVHNWFLICKKIIHQLVKTWKAITQDVCVQYQYEQFRSIRSFMHGMPASWHLELNNTASTVMIELLMLLD